VKRHHVTQVIETRKLRNSYRTLGADGKRMRKTCQSTDESIGVINGPVVFAEKGKPINRS